LDTSLPVLIARGVQKSVRDGDAEVSILSGIDLELMGGQQVALVGPSGSGKSSLLSILGALDPDFEGSVRVGGVELSDLGDRALAELRNKRFGFVFQAYNLLGHLSALDNVLLPARVAGERPDLPRAREVLGRVRMEDKAHRFPGSLSGGERQRVAIARALYHDPPLIFCDEPTGNLDPKTGEEILRLFATLAEQGATLLIATHDQEIASGANRVIRLEAGVLR